MITQNIAIANQKCSVRQTTTYANLGIRLAQTEKLLIDGNPQDSMTISMDPLSWTNCPLLCPTR